MVGNHGNDYHWLIFKIGKTGTAIYSENHISWDVQEFGKQRAANERQIRPFAKTVPGLNNLWIVHTEELTDDYTFDAFVEKMLNSPLEIQMSFEDDFTECLHRFKCLESGALPFLLCLRSHCNIEVKIEIEPHVA